MTVQKIESQSIQESIENGSSFWTDGKNVYYRRNQVPLKNANPKNIWCWRDYAFDDKRVFLGNGLLRGVSPAGFCVLNHAFVRTESHVVTKGGVIKCSMADCVKVLDDGMWYGDKELSETYAKGYILVNEDVWYEGHWSQGLVKLSRVNAEKFVSLKDGVLGMDDERVYAFGKIVRGASAKDFKKIKDSIQYGYYTSNGYLYFEDTRMMQISFPIENIQIRDKEGQYISVNGIEYYRDIEDEE